MNIQLKTVFIINKYASFKFEAEPRFNELIFEQFIVSGSSRTLSAGKAVLVFQEQRPIPPHWQPTPR